MKRRLAPPQILVRRTRARKSASRHARIRKQAHRKKGMQVPSTFGRRLRLHRACPLGVFALLVALFAGVGVASQKHTADLTERSLGTDLAQRDNQVRFKVNVGAAERARLKISSKLLALAEVVWDDSHRRGN